MWILKSRMHLRKYQVSACDIPPFSTRVPRRTGKGNHRISSLKHQLPLQVYTEVFNHRLTKNDLKITICNFSSQTRLITSCLNLLTSLQPSYNLFFFYINCNHTSCSYHICVFSVPIMTMALFKILSLLIVFFLSIMNYFFSFLPVWHNSHWADLIAYLSLSHRRHQFRSELLVL